MTLAVVEDSEPHVPIPVRGHRWRDWLWRLRRRGGDGPCADPPESRRIVSETGLRIEVLLPGFRAADVALRAVGDRLELEARRETAGPEGRELRVARLALAVGDRYAPELARADLARDCLVVAIPLRSTNVVRIPVDAR